jgi:hypothetical protein
VILRSSIECRDWFDVPLTFAFSGIYGKFKNRIKGGCGATAF